LIKNIIGRCSLNISITKLARTKGNSKAGAMIKTFYDRNANLKNNFSTKKTNEKKKKRKREEGKRRKPTDTPPRGTLTRKIPAVVAQFYLQWLNEILKNVRRRTRKSHRGIYCALT